MINSIQSGMTTPAVGEKIGATTNKDVPKEKADSDVEVENTQVEAQEPTDIEKSEGQTGETRVANVESEEEDTQTGTAETGGYDANSALTETQNETPGSVINLVA